MLLLSLLSLVLAGAPGVLLPQPIMRSDVDAFAAHALAEGAKPAASRLACEDLAEGISLCFRVEAGGKLRFVTEADLTAWEMSREALRANAAGAGKESPLQQRAIEGGGVYYEIVAEQGHESLLLLHPEWLASLGPRPRVAFPARGVALAWAADDPEVDHIMAVAVRRAYEQYDGPISPLVLTWDAGKWRPWGEAKPTPPAPSP
ncbi:MAG: hypothetical protein H6741_02715 [Alphaproteobacteria bacterium]|nr:hypothetical protein [Alphaproteobacteria bacterium]MCB9791617.1 hypothetical protein [Alphaproteobacteria bacterium]